MLVYTVALVSNTIRKMENSSGFLYHMHLHQQALSRSNMSYSSDGSINTRRECVGTIFCSGVKMPRIHLLIYYVRSNRSTARFTTILNLGRACRHPMHTYRGMRPYTGTAFSVAVLSGGALTGLSFDCWFGGRNELLTRFGLAQVSGILSMLRCVPALMLTKIRI